MLESASLPLPLILNFLWWRNLEKQNDGEMEAEELPRTHSTLVHVMSYLSSYMPSISDGVYSVKKPVTVAKAIPVDLGPMQPLKITM